jgi:hypothetical protein
MHEINKVDVCALTSRNLLTNRECKNRKYNALVDIGAEFLSILD